MNIMRVRKTSFFVVRWAVLLGVLGFVTWEYFAHIFVSKTHASVHALCPLGGLESLLRWITADGATLGKVFSGTMGLFFVSVGIALLFKRAFCGMICPLGTLQELAGNLGRKILGPMRFLVPLRADRILRYAKYAILALTIYMAWATGTLWIQSFDPWPAYSHIFAPAELFPAYAIGFGILVVSLIASFFYERFFCKYLCAMGALVAVVGLVSPFKVRRDKETCIDCGLCDKACPTNITVSKKTAILDAECISCAKCAAVCPVQGTLDIGLAKMTRISPSAAVALAAGTFFLAIFGLQTLGFDRTSGMQEPSLRELVKSSGTTMEEFKNRYGLPENLSAGTRSSKIEEAIPLAKMAEMSGTDAVELKTSLGLDPNLSDETPWGVAYGLVSLSRIAELNGTTFDQMKTLFALPDSLGPDSKWKDAKALVEKAIKRMGDTGGGEGEGGH